MRLILAAVVTAALALPETLAGQTDEFTTLKWWHPVVAVTGIGILFAVDQPVRKFVQGNRSATLDDVSDVAKRFKEPEVFYVAGGGAIAVGLLAGLPTVTRTGLQIFAAYGLSSVMMIATKWVFGRSRPSQTPNDALNFDWFNGGGGSSFPSGSAAVVFSLATTVADVVDHPVASVVLYGGATLNSWSRVNGNRHWVTDVALGALYGITAAKLVNGRWRVFGLRPPKVLVGLDGRTTVQYSASW